MEKTQIFRTSYKKTPLLNKNIEVRPSSIHGYGVFAKKKFSPGEIIEECPLVLLKKSEPLFVLNDLAFNWDNDYHVLALGYGSLYNHATKNNSKHYRDEENQLLIFKAVQTIYPNEEICPNYGEAWFTSRGVKIKEPLSHPNWYRIWHLIGLIAFIGILFLISAPKG